MATPLVHLKTWIRVLEQYTQALRTYTTIIDDAARKSRPADRVVYQSALMNTLPADPPAGLADIRGVDLAKNTFPLLSRLDRIRIALDAGTVAALNSALREEAVERMSRTFAEDTDAKAAHLHEARAQAINVGKVAAAALADEWASRLAEGSPEEVSAIYFGCETTTSGTMLYSATLEVWICRKVNIATYIERAKDNILGIPLDSPATVQKAIEARADLHPLQAMGITFGLIPENSKVDRRAAISIDITLPQARTSVRYDLAPLIDAQVAAKYGPIASSNSGLSYRLVERLLTIHEEVLPPATRHPDRGETVRGSPTGITIQDGGIGPDDVIIRTTNRGTTTQELRPPIGLLAEAFGTIGAGPRPRIEHLGELLEEAIYGKKDARCNNIKEDLYTSIDPEKLVEDYDAKVDDLSPDFTLNELGQIFIARFTEEYEADPPTTADDLLSAITGQRRNRNMYRTYIARAITEVLKRGSDRQLMRQEASGGSSGVVLFGSRTLASRGSRQEVLISQMADLSASIGVAQRKLLQAFYRINGTVKAQMIYRDAITTRPGKVFVAAAADRRTQVLKLYQNVIDEAFYSKIRPTRGNAARVVEKGRTIEPRLSMKLYVLEHWGRTDAI